MHDPWPLQGARLTGWRSSMLDAVPGLPGALVDPDAAPLVLYSPGVSGIRFWWGPLEEGASTVGEVPDRDSGSVFRKLFCLPSLKLIASLTIAAIYSIFPGCLNSEKGGAVQLRSQIRDGRAVCQAAETSFQCLQV